MKIFIHYDEKEPEFTLTLNWPGEEVHIKYLIYIFKKNYFEKTGLNLERVVLLDNNDQTVKKFIENQDYFIKHEKNIQKKEELIIKSTNQKIQKEKIIPQEKGEKKTNIKQKEEEGLKSDQFEQVQKYVKQIEKEAQEFFEKKQFKNAIISFENLLKYGLDKEGCLGNLSLISYQAGIWRKVLQYCKQLLEINKNDYVAIVRIAESYFNLKDYELSYEHFKLAYEIIYQVSLYQKEPQVALETQKNRVWMARCLFEKDEKKAEELILSVLNENSEFGEALLALAELHIKQKKIDEAFSIILVT
jgi:tetratricopeptide (TPR) repeat protein